MGEKIVVGPVNKGLRNDRTPFVIDDDSFPVLLNAYQWRGRVKRKRGTSLLGRLTRYFNSANISYGSITSFSLIAGAGNILTSFSLQSGGNIVPGTVTLTDSTSGDVYTDDSLGDLIGVPAGTGQINYATGAITITGGGTDTITTVSFLYTPDIPVMGLEDFIGISTQFPGTIAFDQTYSYNIITNNPYDIYDVSFYKNPPTDASNLPAYVPKSNVTPITWNGQNYQQFFTVNYEGAMWATNGIQVPFVPSAISMQFAPASTISFVSQTATTITLTITNCPLVIGDFVFLNEWGASSTANATTLNFQSGYVTACAPNTIPLATKTVTITLPFAALATDTYIPGIVQYLTTRANTTVDCIRWYDGDPTNGNPTNPVLNGMKGWVNFCPPLSRSNYSIADLPPAVYYLVGARLIVPFKDRLLFIGPVVQTSTGSATPIYLQDTVIYSQNGTPYYTSSFTGDPSFVTTVFHPILTPTNLTATASAYWEDQTGFGGFIAAGIDQPILTASPNEDALVLGFSNIQTKLIYSGNDIVPFNFYITNSELGSGSTFSTINMDYGVITFGNRGFIITNQTSAQRIDIEIPDEAFQVSLNNNGNERFCSQRDFVNEWIYFTYPVNNITYVFPNQTLFYNYRDRSWSIFQECYTTYGTFRPASGLTWGTVGKTFPIWASWNAPWNAGTFSVFEPVVIGGNQQGFIIFRDDDDTDEDPSLYIENISGNTVTSPNHCLNAGDYIIISGCLGTVGPFVNGQIFSVGNPTTNTFLLNPGNIPAGLTYLGLGLIKRMFLPFIQTKQFPVSWGISRKTRLGPQQYLFTTTDISQITLLIYLSQNANFSYNNSPIVPASNSINNSLVYSTVLYTCPESSNLGLTAANTNLNLITSQQQLQTWHRMNTSLLGDTVQVGFTLSDSQMRSFSSAPNAMSFAIIGASQANPCVLTCTAGYSAGTVIQISGIIGMTQLNFNPATNNNYSVISSTGTTVTINVNSTTFNSYISGGSAIVVSPVNQFAEIEVHGLILDVSPSQVLA